jgi:hypothetical protein
VDSFSDEELDDIMEAFDDMNNNGSTIHWYIFYYFQPRT